MYSKSFFQKTLQIHFYIIFRSHPPIFPHKQGIIPVLGYKRNEVPIPDEDHYIAMDNNIGHDFIAVLY